MLCASFSKSFSPGFRIGWVAPGRHYHRLQTLKFINTIGVPELLQLAAAEFLANGGYVLWVVMPERVNVLELYEQALKHGIGICSGTMFSASGRYRYCFRMSCGMRWSEAFEQAVARLGGLVKEIAGRG